MRLITRKYGNVTVTKLQQHAYSVISVTFCNNTYNSLQNVQENFPTPSSLPELHHLDLIKGNGKTVRVIEQVAAKWEKVATRLYFKSHDLSHIRQDSHRQTIDACRTVFIEWLQGKGRKPTSWDTVIKALEEADLSELAGDLKVVLHAS